MNDHAIFTGMATAAAAINAEDAFDRCLAHLRSDERNDADGRYAFVMRTIPMSHTDTMLENKARANALDYLRHQTDPDKQAIKNIASHGRWNRNFQNAIRRQHPEQNDPFSVKGANDQYGRAIG
jgi:hypothetical protein